MADSSVPTGHLELQAWTPSQQSPKRSIWWERWERISLFVVVVSGFFAVLLPLWPGAQWPEMALITALAAIAGIAGILAFFFAYLRARTS